MPIATFPSKYLREDSGTIALKIYHAIAPSGASFLNVGDFNLSYTDAAFVLKNKTKTLTLTRPLAAGYISIFWSWENSLHRIIVQDKTGTQIATSASNWQSFVVENIDLIGVPLYTGSIVLLETHVTSLVANSTASIQTEGADYLSAISSGRLTESIPQARNHSLSDMLPTTSMFFGRDFRDTTIRYMQKPYLEATPAPMDQSPILVSDEDGAMTRQYFFDRDTAEYADTNVEIFTLRNETTFVLSYQGLDPNYPPIVLIQDEKVPVLSVNGYEVTITLTEAEKENWYGETVSIRYRLDRSYHVEWNKDAAHDSYIVQIGDRENKPITITQEGNRFHTVKLATEVELNPILNPRHTGFLYIDKEEQQAQAFRLNLSSSYLLTDGMDSADFIVELIDENGNEILSPYLDVFIADKSAARLTEFGELVPIVTEDTLQARNAAGRCYFRYRAPLLYSEKDKTSLFLVAYDRKSGLGAQIPLRLRMPRQIKESSTINVPLYANEGVPEASLPFEYFARFYGRKLPQGHPLSELDADSDGVLTRSDWLAFQEKIQDAGYLSSLSKLLNEQEVF